jgi:hypothetical protein
MKKGCINYVVVGFRSFQSEDFSNCSKWVCVFEVSFCQWNEYPQVFFFFLLLV